MSIHALKLLLINRTLIRFLRKITFRRTTVGNRDAESSKQTLYLWSSTVPIRNVAFCYSGDDSVNPREGGKKKEHCVTMLLCYVIFQRIMNSFQRKKCCPGLPYFLPSFLVYRLCRIKIILQSVLVDTGKKIKGSFKFRSIFCSIAAAELIEAMHCTDKFSFLNISHSLALNWRLLCLWEKCIE